MKLHFQVSIMDKRDYILDWKNFDWAELRQMLEFIRLHSTSAPCQAIKITRWDRNGEMK